MNTLFAGVCNDATQVDDVADDVPDGIAPESAARSRATSAMASTFARNSDRSLRFSIFYNLWLVILIKKLSRRPESASPDSERASLPGSLTLTNSRSNTVDAPNKLNVQYNIFLKTEITTPLSLYQFVELCAYFKHDKEYKSSSKIEKCSSGWRLVGRHKDTASERAVEVDAERAGRRWATRRITEPQQP